MKNLVLVLLFCSPLTAGFAQCYSQIALIYAPTPIAGTVVAPTDDGFTPAIPIGFNFCFYGAGYDSLYIGTNGLVTFSPTTGTWAITQPIPNITAVPRNCIMAPWQDLSVLGGTISYVLTGISPNRMFVVDFDSVLMYSCTTMVYHGQIKLFETTNVIETHIGTKALCSTWNAGRAIHGLHNAQGTMASVVPGRNFPNTWITGNEGMQFNPTCNVCQGSGVDENNTDSDITVYPNPSSGIFHVFSGNSDLTSVKIMSADGKLLKVAHLDKAIEEIDLDLSGYAKGVYFLEIRTKKGAPLYRKLLLTSD